MTTPSTAETLADTATAAHRRSARHAGGGSHRAADQAAMLLNGRIIWNGPAAQLMASGNPAVDQFTHGRRKGPIHMELRR